MKTVVLCVTGGIASYKACDLVSKLKKLDINVHVLMTKSATEFVAPLTFESLSGNAVVSNMFDRNFNYDVEHISLAKKADVFAIVPATANVIGKICHGIADDMVTTTVMATKAPILFAPAMNTNMFENPAVEQNIQILKERGAHFVEPASGRLACGDIGRGKLADIDEILEEILTILSQKDLVGQKIVVTAGATAESIDPVRFISNHSTGKMGYEIAKASRRRGADVTLISGKSSLNKPFGCNVLTVNSASDMKDAVLENFSDADILIKAAAVSDFTPVEINTEKIKKKDADLTLKLQKTDDILSEVAKIKKENQFVCGFSMETQNLIENSTKKLVGKNLDLIVCNDLMEPSAGFAVDTNIVTLISKQNNPKKLDVMSKLDVANFILDEILKLR